LLLDAFGRIVSVESVGRNSHGLRFGVQVLGRRWDDERLLAISALLAQVTAGFQPPPGY
jgi:Asp-tRNA(Asn)/Glu-tRNA(Gln) amidotransferase A subunit family amidase